MALRIVGISASPRHGNTEILIKKALEAAGKTINEYGEKVELDFISFSKKKIEGCIDCRACIRKGTYCVLKDDWLDILGRLTNPVPNGVIIGSPVYFFNVDAKLRAFMERFTSVLKKAWYPEHPVPIPDWSKTAAGAIAVGYHRNGGQEHAIANIVNWFLSLGFVVVSDFSQNHGPISYIGTAGWEQVAGSRGTEAVLGDADGILSAVSLGENVGRTAALLAQRTLRLDRGEDP